MTIGRGRDHPFGYDPRPPHTPAPMKGGLQSFVGPVWVEVLDGQVIACGWGEVPDTGSDPVLSEALAQLSAYFSGDLTVFDLPLAAGKPGLQADVMAAMSAIPFGETRTYGDLAKDLGAPPQAVGQACGANPIPIIVPCHRVLSATGLGGFSGDGGVETKVELLRHEGAASLLI